MDFDEFKKLIDNENTKILIIENGNPSYVVMTFQEYEKNKNVQQQLKFKEVENKEKILIKEFEAEPLKIEDLPL